LDRDEVAVDERGPHGGAADAQEDRVLPAQLVARALEKVRSLEVDHWSSFGLDRLRAHRRLLLSVVWSQRLVRYCDPPHAPDRSMIPPPPPTAQSESAMQIRRAVPAPQAARRPCARASRRAHPRSSA